MSAMATKISYMQIMREIVLKRLVSLSTKSEVYTHFLVIWGKELALNSNTWVKYLHYLFTIFNSLLEF